MKYTNYMGWVVLFSLIFTIACKERSGSKRSKNIVFSEEYLFKQSIYCEQDSNTCATVKAIYPFIEKGRANAKDRINQSIEKELKLSLAVFNTEEEIIPLRLEEIANRFIEDYEAYIKEAGTDFITPWVAESYGKVLYQNQQIVSIELDHHSYAGGAHPNTYVSLMSFDLETGQKLDYIDIVEDVQSLKQTVEIVFRKKRGLAEKEDFIQAGYFLDNGFQLPENFALTKEGIYCHFNPYEIAPYAMGSTSFLISYQDVELKLK